MKLGVSYWDYQLLKESGQDMSRFEIFTHIEESTAMTKEEILQEELPTTNDLYKKHFGNSWGAGIFHPNMERFFEELNEVCKKEDEQRERTN